MVHVRIRFFREKKGMTRAELAEAIGVSEAEIMAYEGHFESPKLDKAIAIADALGVTLADLVREV